MRFGILIFREEKFIEGKQMELQNMTLADVLWTRRSQI
jgi:hypothetical protein